MLELSERMGMTRDELGRRMSSSELTARRALAIVHREEHEQAAENGGG